jgi:ABC-type lipopolysaccharide export system ATPase subunit
MTVALEARDLGKRYGRRWALSGCTLSVPAGRVAGLVGPDGTLVLQGVGTCPGKPSGLLTRSPQQGFLQAWVKHLASGTC